MDAKSIVKDYGFELVTWEAFMGTRYLPDGFPERAERLKAEMLSAGKSVTHVLYDPMEEAVECLMVGDDPDAMAATVLRENGLGPWPSEESQTPLVEEDVKAKVVGRTAFSSHPLTVDIVSGASSGRRVRLTHEQSRHEELGPFQIGDELVVRLEGDSVRVTGRDEPSPPVP